MNGLWILVFLFLEMWGLSLLSGAVGRDAVLFVLVGKAVLALIGVRWALSRWLPRTLATRPERALGVIAVVVGGLALAVPGLISDLFGLSLLIPGVRSVWKPLVQRAAGRFAGGAVFGSASRGRWSRSETLGASSGGASAADRSNDERRGPAATGPIVDADFRVLDE